MAINGTLFVILVLVILWAAYRSTMGKSRASRLDRTALGDAGAASFVGSDPVAVAVSSDTVHHHGGTGGHGHAAGYGGDGGGHAAGGDGGGGHGGGDGGGGGHGWTQTQKAG